MRIKRANFRFNRLVNVDDIIGHSNLLLMEQEDINVDNNVHDCILRIICANFYIIAKKNEWTKMPTHNQCICHYQTIDFPNTF